MFSLIMPGYGLLGAVEEATAEEIERLYATNVFGLLKVTRAVLPYMRRQRSGHILNFSSIGGYFGYPGWGVYGSTKFAVEGLSESMAAELEPFGIKVTIVEPGFFRTDFLADTSLAVSPASIADYEGTPLKQHAQFRRRRQPYPARQSRQARNRHHDDGQLGQSAAADAVRQRHGGRHRAAACQRRKGTCRLAPARAVHGFSERCNGLGLKGTARRIPDLGNAAAAPL